MMKNNKIVLKYITYDKKIKTEIYYNVITTKLMVYCLKNNNINNFNRYISKLNKIGVTKTCYKSGLSALSILIYSKKYNMAIQLLKTKYFKVSDIIRIDYNCISILSFLFFQYNNHKKMVLKIMKYIYCCAGVNKSILLKKYNGNTILHWCVVTDNLTLFKLIHYYLKPSINEILARNGAGETVIDLLTIYDLKNSNKFIKYILKKYNLINIIDNIFDLAVVKNRYKIINSILSYYKYDYNTISNIIFPNNIIFNFDLNIHQNRLGIQYVITHNNHKMYDIIIKNITNITSIQNYKIQGIPFFTYLMIYCNNKKIIKKTIDNFYLGTSDYIKFNSLNVAINSCNTVAVKIISANMTSDIIVNTCKSFEFKRYGHILFMPIKIFNILINKCYNDPNNCLNETNYNISDIFYMLFKESIYNNKKLEYYDTIIVFLINKFKINKDYITKYNLLYLLLNQNKFILIKTLWLLIKILNIDIFTIINKYNNMNIYVKKLLYFKLFIIDKNYESIFNILYNKYN